MAPPVEEATLFGADPGRLKNVKPRDLLARFAFGAMISFAAGIVSIAVNPVAGGMFLAFPAILPATITLIEKREGTDEAVADMQGSIIGAGGLVPFALTVGLLLPRTDAPVALLAAFAAWLLASCAGYVVVEESLRRGRHPDAPPRPLDLRPCTHSQSPPVSADPAVGVPCPGKTGVVSGTLQPPGGDLGTGHDEAPSDRAGRGEDRELPTPPQAGFRLVRRTASLASEERRAVGDTDQDGSRWNRPKGNDGRDSFPHRA